MRFSLATTALVASSLLSYSLGGSIDAGPTSAPTAPEPTPGIFTRQLEVVNFIETEVIGRSLEVETVWMIDAPISISASAFVRDYLGSEEDFYLPYDETWVAMVDLQPEANFGHDVLVVVVDEALTQHTTFPLQMPPSVRTEYGDIIPIPCVSGLTPADCTPLASEVTEESLAISGRVGTTSNMGTNSTDSCLHAVLASGGIDVGSNYARYPQNLKSVYKKINGGGYPADQIFSYYADGSYPLDLDDDATTGTNGNDITGAATLSAIRGKIQSLCMSLDSNEDVLFIYTTNHGCDDQGLCLWDFDGNGRLDINTEIYQPSQLESDTANCNVKRLIIVMDQCFSGEFSYIANLPTHRNTAVYTAANADNESWRRDYMEGWETIDISKSVNAMHDAAKDIIVNRRNGFPNSMPQEDGTDNGKTSLKFCGECETEEPNYPPASGPSFVTGIWVPPLSTPGVDCDHKRIKIPGHGTYTCMEVGKGICRDNGGNFGEWRFGIDTVAGPNTPDINENWTYQCPLQCPDESTYPSIIDPATKSYPLIGPYIYATGNGPTRAGEICKVDGEASPADCRYAGTTHVCIGENTENDPNKFTNERPYMFFYDEKRHEFLYQLVCDGAGELGKLPQLKMVNNEDLATKTYVNYPVDIAKFKKGATADPSDVNELWDIYVDWNGYVDPVTRRIGKLAAFTKFQNNFCTEYVEATSTACWEKGANCANVQTSDSNDLRADC